MPAYYPAFIDVKNRCCVVIGGGNIGEEKVVKLLDCHANVVVISPEVNEGVRDLADDNRVVWHKREYESRRPQECVSLRLPQPTTTR